MLHGYKLVFHGLRLFFGGGEGVVHIRRNVEFIRFPAAGDARNFLQFRLRGGFQALIRDKELAAKLDRNAKAVVTGDDAEAAIAEAREKIAREPKNINYYRALARIFLQNKRFDEALEVFDGARKVNPADPELDRNWADTKVRAYEAQIDALKAQGKERGAAYRQLMGRKMQLGELMALYRAYGLLEGQ